MKTQIEVNEKLTLDASAIDSGHVVLNVLNFATGKSLPLFITEEDAKKLVAGLIDAFSIEMETENSAVVGKVQF